MNRLSVRRSTADYPSPTPQLTPCRLWQGAINNKGYGKRPDQQLIHRWVWEQVNGPIPPGMCVLHRCDQPLCFRYDHLFLGTKADNHRDMVEKGRGIRLIGPHRPPSPHGTRHPTLTEDQVREIRTSSEKGVELAVRFGVSSTAISQIRRGKTWRWLP